MSLRASAPGKLVLVGEYAVLEGAPALVLAVDRRARVALEPIADPVFVIDAPDFGVRDAMARLDAGGRLLPGEPDPARERILGLVGRVIEAVAAVGTVPGCRLSLDTQAFSSPPPERRKFGFGSSAALAVALGGALHAHAGLGPPSADALIAAHRRAQDGRGSGLDIAASLNGGLVRYQVIEGQAQATLQAWPETLHFCCAWSMRAASTAVFLRALAAWRAGAPARYAALMRELATCAATATAALAGRDVATLLEAVVAYAAGLARLGEASGLDIVSAEHRALAAVAADCGVAYKPCGAGGGDIGVALAADADRLRAFRHGVLRAGLRILDARLEPHGLQVD